MAIYLTHISALEFYQAYRLGAFGNTAVKRPSLTRRPHDAVNTVSRIARLSESAQSCLLLLSQPYEVMVFSQSAFRSSVEMSCRVCTKQLPPRSFVRYGEDLYVVSPELLLAQYAQRFGMYKTLLLAMELCGSYSHLRGEIEYGVRPVASIQSCMDYLSSCTHLASVQRTLRYVRHCQDSSASPMETAIYLMLCLPTRYGGYQLPKAQLNPKVNVGISQQPMYIRPDLFWKEAGIAIEYNSRQFHSTPTQGTTDAKRQIEMISSNYIPLSLTPDIVMNVDIFDTFARSLLKRLKDETRIRAKYFEDKRAKLRKAVLPIVSRN